MTSPTVAVFRPADDRLDSAISTLESLGAEPVADPMLAIEPTGAVPRSDAAITVFTSRTGVDLVANAGWRPPGTVCAIGEGTATRLRAQGYTVDIVPETYSSSGLVTTLRDSVDGTCIDVARSDHGSAVLLDGLNDAGAYVHETVLYELVRPPSAGVSTDQAAAGTLDGALFTSSLTVEHFVAAADDRGHRDAAIAGLNTGAVVGTIGEPTRDTATDLGIAVDVVAPTATFDALADAVVSAFERES